MGIINEQIPNYDHYNIEEEVKNLKEALHRLELTTPDSFFADISTGDIIEIYSYPENKQLYGNGEFHRLCSYTPEQMKNIAYPKLFWRSDEDNRALLDRAAYVTTHENESVPWRLPDHELIESLHPRKRTFKSRLNFIAPCFDIRTRERRAWVCAVRVLFMFEWDEDL